MKRSFIHILMMLAMLSAYTQGPIPDHVCGLEKEISPHLLLGTSKKFPANSEMHKYLEELKQLFLQPYARYELREISNNIKAAAHLINLGHNLPRTISINYQYFQNTVKDTAYRKALLIWVLAHEMTHHINGDLHYDPSISARNLRKEVIADERAGYAVGILANVDIKFFDLVLPKILQSKKHSLTHPASEYRLIAAKSGWVQAKLSDSDNFQLNNNHYHKYTFGETTVMGLVTNKNTNGISYFKYDSGDLYFGYKKDGNKDGKGIFITNRPEYGIYFGKFEEGWFSGKGSYFWPSGSKYEGHFRKSRREGFGIHCYPRGQIYRGLWKNDYEHGEGILVKGNQVIQAGCWEDGQFIGEECNH